MTKIRCTLPNASEEMNGIKFAVDAGGGMVSVDAVPEDLAAIFLSVPGFTAEAGKKAPAIDPEKVAADAAEAQRIKDKKAADAKAAKDKKAADALLAKEAAKATKGVKPAEETPAADADAKAPESTEGTESTQAAETGKPEGEV